MSSILNWCPEIVILRQIKLILSICILRFFGVFFFNFQIPLELNITRLLISLFSYSLHRNYYNWFKFKLARFTIVSRNCINKLFHFIDLTATSSPGILEYSHTLMFFWLLCELCELFQILIKFYEGFFLCYHLCRNCKKLLRLGVTVVVLKKKLF